MQVGVLEGVELSTSESGTAQGSVLSPLLANVNLHSVLNLWFEQEVKPRLLVLEQAKRSWYKWLCRRSQRERLT